MKNRKKTVKEWFENCPDSAILEWLKSYPYIKQLKFSLTMIAIALLIVFCYNAGTAVGEALLHLTH